MGLKELYTATGAKILGASTAAKAIGAAAAASAVIAGAAAGVHAYTNGLDFTPNGAGRALRANQVHFDGSENTIGRQDKQEKNGESEMYERDENAAEKEKPQTGDSASYLFENAKQQENQSGLLDGNGTAAAIAGTVTAGGAAGAQPGTLLDIVKNPAAADIVLHPGDTAPVTNPAAGDTANGGSNASQPSVSPVNPSTGGDTSPNQPSTPSTPSDNGSGSSGRPSSGGENSGGSNSGATTPETPVTPTNPAEKPQQTDGKPPEQTTEEGGPEIPWGDSGTRFDGTVTPSDGSEVTVVERLNNADALYVGQVINDADIVRALSAYVTVDGEIYYWTSDDLGKYIKINRVSFDGGKTWVTDFTKNIEIPKSAGNQPMQVDMSYRFSESEPWTDYRPGEGSDYVGCSVVRHRILVLSRDLTDEDTEIPLDIVLNDNYYYNDNNRQLNLYAMQRKLYNKLYGWDSGTPYDQLPPLKKLFPGWMENGEPVSWSYTCDGGRHVLQPSDLVDVPEGYTVRLKINEGMTWETQTLTNFDDSILDKTDSENGTLTVPDCIQAVALEDEVAPIRAHSSAYGDAYSDVCSSNVADYFKIPASVVYIKNDGCGNVLKGYIVDEDNPNYAATEDGILTNEDGTEYLAVPVLKESVTVPDTVKKVKLPEGYSGTVVLESTEKLPEIDFGENFFGTIETTADMTNAIVKTYGTLLAKEQNTLYETDTEKEYAVHDGYLTHEDEDGATVLDRVITDARIFMMPAGIDKIGADAFSNGTPNLTGILLQSDDETIAFDADAFAGRGNVDIICTSEEQMANVEKSLDGVKGASVKAADKSDEGYSYIQIDDNCILLKAPENITEFDGALTIGEQTIQVNSIAAHAFDGCSSLTYVSLPETVKTIGVSAFENCSALSGVMIENTDTVTVMDRAFNNCKNLRFIASNAENLVLDNDYDILSGSGSGLLEGELWAPTYREGYRDGWIGFIEENGITSYNVQDVNGLKLLYGATGDQNWLAIRAAADTGTSQAETARYSLDPNTTEIYERCFSNLSNTFTIDWDGLPELFAIDQYAFAYSGLSGTLKLSNTDYYIQIGDYALQNTQLEEADFSNVALSEWGRLLFNSCPNLKKVTMGETMINPPGTANEGDYSSVLRSLSFFDCPNFAELVFTTKDPIGLLTEGYNEQYVFRDAATDRDIKITLTEGDKEAYYEKWRSKFIGYTDEEIDDGTYYINTAMFSDISWLEWYFPEDKWPEFVQAVCDYRVIHAENNLRAMMGMELLDEPENPEEHKEDYGYVDPWGDFDWFDQPSDKPIDTTPAEDDDQIKIDIEIPDENPDITQSGQTAADETVSDETGDETGGETVSGETETGEAAPSVDAPDGEDAPSDDTNNTESAPEASDAAEGETT